MTRVPLYRGRQADLLSHGRQKAILIGGVPIPADTPVLGEVPPRDEVHRKAERVGRLPWPRFAGPLRDECKLPVGVAECLKDFEMGLRLAGLIGAGEFVRQTAYRHNHFRCEKFDVVEAVHSGGSFTEPGGFRDEIQSPASVKVPRPRDGGGSAVKAKERQRALTGEVPVLLAMRVDHERALQLKRAKRAGRSPYLTK